MTRKDIFLSLLSGFYHGRNEFFEQNLAIAESLKAEFQDPRRVFEGLVIEVAGDPPRTLTEKEMSIAEVTFIKSLDPKKVSNMYHPEKNKEQTAMEF